MISPDEQLESLLQMRKKGSINKTEYGHMLTILLNEMEKNQITIQRTIGEINLEISRLETSDKIGNEKLYSVLITAIIILATIFALVYLS